MRHDAELVQRGLPVEKDDVAVYHVPLHDVAEAQLLRYLLSVAVFQEPAREQT